MNLNYEEITWEVVSNTVEKRMVNSSLVHRFVTKRKLKRRTRILNSMLKNTPAHSYSQYIRMKTSVLRDYPHDTDSDDSENLTDEDYEKIYKSEDSFIKYFAKFGRRSKDLPCTLDSDDEYISLSQPNASRMQDSLGWKRVIKKKSKSVQVKSNPGKSSRSQSQRATSRIKKDPDENSVDDVPLNERYKDGPSKNPTQPKSTYDKHIVETTQTGSSQNSNSQEKIMNEVLLNDSIKQESLVPRKSAECTTTKHSKTISEKSCKKGEYLENSMENMNTSKRSKDSSCSVDSDDDYVPSSQLTTNGIQHSFGWQMVIKNRNKLIPAQSNPDKSQGTDLQKTTSHDKKDLGKNSTTGKKIMLTKKINDKKLVSIQNSIKQLFIGKQLNNDNDTLTQEKSVEDMPSTILNTQCDLVDDVPLNERYKNVPSKNPTEPKSTHDKHIVETTQTGSSQNSNSQEKMVNEVLLNDSTKQESLVQRKSECTTEKQSKTKSKKSCKEKENLEDSMIHMDTSKRSKDLSCTVDSDDDVPSSQLTTNGIQHSLSWQKEIRNNNKLIQAQSNPDKSERTDLQKATSLTPEDPDKNSTTGKKKRLAKKIGDKKSSKKSQNSSKGLCIDQQLSEDNDASANENNGKDISDIDLHIKCESKDDVPLNEPDKSVSSIGPSEPRSADDKQTVQITNRGNSQDNSSQDNTVNEEQPNDSIEQDNSPQRKSDQCAMEKHSDTKEEKSSEQKEKRLSEKKEIHDFDVTETDKNNKENIIEHVFQDNKKEATENVKKNLTGAFNNFSIISGNKVSEIDDPNVNQSMDISKSQLRISDISPLCRSTPMQLERTACKIKPVSQNQPKDSGIDEDSQEEYSENGKVKDEMHKRILIDAIENNRVSESTESNDSSDLTDQATMVIDEDRSDRETNDEDENDRENTLVSNSKIIDEEQLHKQKPQLKVTCTEIVNQKYKIITAKPQNEVEYSTDVPEKECDHHQENFNDNSKNEVSIANDQEDHQTQVLHTEEQTRSGHKESSENADEIMSAASEKRLQKLKRLDLTADDSSSEEEDYTACKSQKVSQSTVRNDETDDDSDKEHSSFITKSQSVKNECESEKSPTKTQKNPQVMVPWSLNSTENEAKDVKTKESVLSITQDDKSFSFSESESETDALQNTKSVSTHKADKTMFETRTLPKVKKHAQEDIGKHVQKNIGTKLGVLDSQMQTDISISPQLVLKRPNNLQEYAEQEGMRVIDQQLMSFSSEGLTNNELFVMDIPKKLLKSELLGQKIVLKKNKLELGKRKYRIMHKDVESMICVLNSGDVYEPYKAVQLKPMGVVVTQARLDEEGSTIKLFEVADSESTKTLPSTSGAVTKYAKKRSIDKSPQQNGTKDCFAKKTRKRKLNDSKSLDVFHKKVKKQTKLRVYDHES